MKTVLPDCSFYMKSRFGGVLPRLITPCRKLNVCGELLILILVCVTLYEISSADGLRCCDV